MIMGNWCSARTKSSAICWDVKSTLSSKGLRTPAAAWWPAGKMPCIRNARFSTCGCGRKFPHMRRPHCAGKSHCRSRKGCPRGDLRHGVLHPCPRLILGLAGRCHEALPCRRADPCPHLKREDPLPGGYFCKGRRQECERQHQQGEPEQMQDSRQVRRDGHGHPQRHCLRPSPHRRQRSRPQLL